MVDEEFEVSESPVEYEMTLVNIKQNNDSHISRTCFCHLRQVRKSASH